MKGIFFKQSSMIFVVLTSIFTISSSPLMAEEKRLKVSGMITATAIHSAGVHIDDVEGHNLTLEEGEGTNKSTGEQEFLHGAQVTFFGTSDHVMGNGTGRGYAKLALGDDAVFLKHEGTVETRPPTKGIRNTTFKGTFSFYKGTGRYKNIQGSGTYKGRYISKTIYIAEWEGEYITKK